MVLNSVVPMMGYPMPQYQYGSMVSYPGTMMGCSMTAAAIPPGFLDMLRQSITGEETAAVYYRKLADMVNDPEAKGKILGFADDELTHAQMFRVLYYQLTGQMIPPTTPTNVEVPADLEDAFIEALKDELSDYRKYRDMYLMTSNPCIRDIMFKPMTDELYHAQNFQLFLETDVS